MEDRLSCDGDAHPPSPEGSEDESPAAHADVPLSPAEQAAIDEHVKLSARLAELMAYGRGTDATKRPIRDRTGSRRPSGLLPEAYRDMSKKQRDALELERASERSLVLTQLENLRSKFPTIDFVNQLNVRGAVAPYIDGPMVRDLMQQGWHHRAPLREISPSRPDDHAHPMPHLCSGPLHFDESSY